MTDPQHRADPHSSSSGLGWPLTVVMVAFLGAVVALTLAGKDTAGLYNLVSLALGAVGAGGGIGAWVNSTRAAKQTNGSLTARMEAAVQRGIAAQLGTGSPEPSTSDDAEWPTGIPPSIP